MNAQAIIRSLEAEQMKPQLPELHIGDTVKVNVKIREGGKERVQSYEGTIISMRHGGINRTVTVRRVFQGIGVERVFLVHSPRVDSMTVTRRGKVRRAKLYYLRGRIGKATRVKEKITQKATRKS